MGPVFVLFVVFNSSAIPTAHAGAGTKSAWPQFMTRVGGRVYFLADHGIHGNELWVSDGTRTGTRLVSDIGQGRRDFSDLWLASARGRLLLSGDDGVHGAELWRSDRTRSGTRLVKDIRPDVGLRPRVADDRRR
jgi:ELWxxDGT repeat protein